jgi:tRNA threonylcarbamoyladenosine biosynthesis protein TsaB
VIDARRGQVYLQLFETGHPASEPEAVWLEDAIARLADRSWRITGSGATLVGGEVSTVTAPDPAALAALTVALDPAIHPPRPLYLRAPDATPPTRLPGQARPVVSGA